VHGRRRRRALISPLVPARQAKRRDSACRPVGHRAPRAEHAAPSRSAKGQSWTKHDRLRRGVHADRAVACRPRPQRELPQPSSGRLRPNCRWRARSARGPPGAWVQAMGRGYDRMRDAQFGMCTPTRRMAPSSVHCGQRSVFIEPLEQVRREGAGYAVAADARSEFLVHDRFAALEAERYATKNPATSATLASATDCRSSSRLRSKFAIRVFHNSGGGPPPSRREPVAFDAHAGVGRRQNSRKGTPVDPPVATGLDKS